MTLTRHIMTSFKNYECYGEGHTHERKWLMGKLSMKLKIVIDYLKIKKSKLHIDKDIYNTARYKLQKMIIKKIRDFFKNKLTESIGKPKDLWKALRSLGLPSKTYFHEVNALKIENTVEQDINSV